MLSCSVRTVGRRTWTLASAVFWGARALSASIISRTLREKAEGKIEVVGVFRSMTYDETPLPLRGGQLHDGSKDNRAVTTKVFQSEVDLAILTRDLRRPHGEFSCCAMNLPQVLQHMERGTGLVLHDAVSKACEVPFWCELQQACFADGLSVDVSCCDRASANAVCEDLLYAASGHDVARARMPCQAHMMSTCQGRGFAIASDDLTGVIAASLSMKQGGAAADLRECLVLTLLDPEPNVVDAGPFPPTQSQNVHLGICLRQVLPGTDEGLRRAEELKRELTSDIRDSRITLRVPGGNVDTTAWARRVAALLLPSAIPVFPRQRWCNSLNEICACAFLCGVHDVFFRAGIFWATGEKAQPRRWGGWWLSLMRTRGL